jgi:hypothetical protein
VTISTLKAPMMNAASQRRFGQSTSRLRVKLDFDA